MLSAVTERIVGSVHPHATYDSLTKEWCENDGDGGYVYLFLNLEDVLRAYWKSHKKASKGLMMSHEGQFGITESIGLQGQWTGITWQISKPLSEQSEDCIKFLYYLFTSAA